MSDFDTLAEYRADIEKKMQEAADAQAEEAAKQDLVNTVVGNAEVDVPAPMVEEKLDDMMQQMGWRMQQQGFGLEQYLKMIGQTEQQMRDMYRSEALNNVKSELVIDEIIKAEAVEADDAEVDKMLEGYATSMEQTLDQLKSSFSGAQLDYFKHRVRINKALDLLWDNAKVTDEEAGAEGGGNEASDEQKPAKRTRRKADEADADAQAQENAEPEAEDEKKPTKRTRRKADAESGAEA